MQISFPIFWNPSSSILLSYKKISNLDRFFRYEKPVAKFYPVPILLLCKSNDKNSNNVIFYKQFPIEFPPSSDNKLLDKFRPNSISLVIYSNDFDKDKQPCCLMSLSIRYICNFFRIFRF